MATRWIMLLGFHMRGVSMSTATGRLIGRIVDQVTPTITNDTRRRYIAPVPYACVLSSSQPLSSQLPVSGDQRDSA
ncbi:hypothetical protein FRC09_016741 [Ceratobasidium sp. 395]|nr:hypothetical protein FRC09_016741 [Ceratobasidium sp. 395]